MLVRSQCEDLNNVCCSDHCFVLDSDQAASQNVADAVDGAFAAASSDSHRVTVVGLSSFAVLDQDQKCQQIELVHIFVQTEPSKRKSQSLGKEN